MSPGSVTEHVTFFTGRYDSSTRAGTGGGAVGEHERIDVVEMTLTDAVQAIEAGTIVDGKTVLLVQRLAGGVRAA